MDMLIYILIIFGQFLFKLLKRRIISVKRMFLTIFNNILYKTYLRDNKADHLKKYISNEFVFYHTFKRLAYLLLPILIYKCKFGFM